MEKSTCILIPTPYVQTYILIFILYLPGDVPAEPTAPQKFNTCIHFHPHTLCSCTYSYAYSHSHVLFSYSFSPSHTLYSRRCFLLYQQHLKRVKNRVYFHSHALYSYTYFRFHTLFSYSNSHSHTLHIRRYSCCTNGTSNM